MRVVAGGHGGRVIQWLGDFQVVALPFDVVSMEIFVILCFYGNLKKSPLDKGPMGIIKQLPPAVHFSSPTGHEGPGQVPVPVVRIHHDVLTEVPEFIFLAVVFSYVAIEFYALVVMVMPSGFVDQSRDEGVRHGVECSGEREACGIICSDFFRS